MADNSERINLILASHAHVSYGSPEHEFEKTCENIIKPFISNLYKYPKVQAALHYSGVLLHWIERFRHELFMLIEDMVSRKQAELLGGGFYEPMLPLLSMQDKLGQIELLTTYLRKHFGRRPQGCWLPALVWEQNLAGPLAACGMAYTFLGEDHFKFAGIDGQDIYSPCITEDQGKIITVFPIFHSLEKDLAERNAETVFKELRDRLPQGAERTVSIFPQSVYMSSGESSDYAWNRFFEELSLLESTVECVSPAKILKKLGGLKKACFFESQTHSPRRFLIAHPEANGIYSKMVFTNLLINQLRGDKSRKQNAREELWKAQGCDLFSSTEYLYRHHLRKAAYRSLLTAERITREKAKFSPSLIQFDFDFNGIEEYLFQDQKLNCYIQTLGAGIFELDYMPKAWNYLDTCSHHAQGRRIAFADTLLPADADWKNIQENGDMAGRYCAGKQYTVKNLDRINGEVSFFLPPEDNIPFGGIGITKTFSLKKDSIAVYYSLYNHGEHGSNFMFAPRIDLSFPGDGVEFVRMYTYKAGAKDTPVLQPEIAGTDCLKIKDIKNEALITVTSTNSFDACIKTMYIKDEKTDMYQSTAIIPVFKLMLEQGESWTNEFNIKFTH